MTEPERMVVVTTATNAHALIAGAGVAAVRRRLKLASVLYDRVLLEGGHYEVRAGPGGAWRSRALSPDRQLTWQTSRQRSIGQKGGFSIGLGTPAQNIREVVRSTAAISWDATLEPFRKELPSGCNWFEFVIPGHPPDEVTRASEEWTRADERNNLLQRRFPDKLVRNRIIKDTNDDTAKAAASRLALSTDQLHAEVLAARAQDKQGWRMEGFALPILVPLVGDLSWEAICEVRNDRGLGYLRAALCDIEAEVLQAATSTSSDLEATAHHVLEDRLASANKQAGLGETVRHTAGSLLISTAVGISTMAISGPTGAFVTAGTATGITAVIDIAQAVRNRRANRWIGALTRLKDVSNVHR